MSLSKTFIALLQLEETLLILEESLQHPPFQDSTSKRHISRLKQLYSPLFDFEHSESGSYYYAALQCIKATYIDDDAIYKLPLSSLFVNSILSLLELSTLSLDTKINKNSITETLLNLASLYSLRDSDDMADLITSVVRKLRTDIVVLLNIELSKQHD